MPWIPYDKCLQPHMQFISVVWSFYSTVNSAASSEWLSLYGRAYIIAFVSGSHMFSCASGLVTSASSMSLSCSDEGQRFRKLHIQLCACEDVKSQGWRRTGYQMCFLIICSSAYQQQIRELCWKAFSVACQPISQQRKTELLSPLQNQTAVIPTGLCHFWDQK